jgi:predicted peptidase
MTTRCRLAVAVLTVAGLVAGCTAGATGGPAPTAAAAEPAPQAAAPAAPAPQAPPRQAAMTLKTDAAPAGEVRYLLYLPPGYAKAEKPCPLVLFLHGAGERGDDLNLVKKHGPPKLVEAGKDLPFISVSPQCPRGVWWNAPGQVAGLVALLDHLQNTYRVDPDRVYVTGLSMGGFGTWALAVAQPKRFAAIAPICGKGDPEKAATIAHVPAWVFHGGKDRVVPTRHSEEMVEALKKAGGSPKLTVYPEAGHDSWTQTYNDPKFWEWLLAQRRKG